MALTKVQNTGIADDAITTDKIENSTVVAADIAPGTIANAKLANSSITLNGTATALGGSATLKHIDWQAVTVADGSTTLTAEAGKGYFLDTNTGVIEVFLPSSPTRGDTIVLADYGGTFGTNQIIINTGGNLIDSTTGPDFKVTTNNAVVELVYVDANKGWLVKLNQAAGTTPDSALDEGGGYDNAVFVAATGGTVTTSGNFKIHTFTGDGCFVVSSAGNSGGSNSVDYLVIGGGGAGQSAGGNSGTVGGGGGAGGYRESSGAASGCYTVSPLGACVSALPVSATTYPITVGAGASSQPTGTVSSAIKGSNSVFSTITSAGGGGGSGGQNATSAPHTGGSGGGGGGDLSTGYSGGAGNTPPVSPPQGNPGGNGVAPKIGSGGGGATAAGTPGSPSNPIRAGGGAGATSCITGSPVTRGGGGGGANTNKPSPEGNGGPGGGGSGPPSASGGSGTNGAANTGGGGGGGPHGAPCNNGGSGGKGVVIIRYKFQ